MEDHIKKIVKEAFGTDKVTIHHRLLGGRSNYTYVIEVEEEKYTLRIPGKNGNLFVNRTYEERNLDVVQKLGINNDTVYLNLDTGVKISQYIEGETLFGMDYKNYYPRLVHILKQVHTMPLFKNDYSPTDRLTTYENYCKDLGFEQPKRYYELKESFLSYISFLEEDTLVACHNDAQPSNFIVGADDKVYLTDWEFGGNNYVAYDIACFCDNNIDQSIDLLNAYYKNPSSNKKKRVYLWRMFQTLQWCNVAMYKELIGLSKDLMVDFKGLSEHYLTLAEELLAGAESL